MKNETARREIESLDYYLQNHTNDYSEESHTAMMMAIKALEQQSCDNAINHKDTLKAMIGQLAAEATLYKVVKNMPPVTPQPKVDLDKIREDITAISISGIVDEHTMFIRAGEQVKQMALDIIDKYKAESEPPENEGKE